MWIVLGAVLFGSLSSGMLIGVALALSGFVVMYFWGGGVHLLPGVAWDSLNNYSLVAMPGFIFMGETIKNANLGSIIFESLAPLMSRFPGKLLHATVAMGAIFAAVLGSTVGGCIIVGSTAIPELRKRGYDERLLLGIVAASGMLAIMIPPSMGFILYGVMGEVSIAALFAAGTIPGLLLAGTWAAYIAILAKLRPSIAPAKETPLPLAATARSLVRIWPAAILVVLAVAPIYLGLVTVAEGAGIGALAAVIVGGSIAGLRWQGLKTSLKESAGVSAMALFLVLGAMILAVSLSQTGQIRAIVETVTNVGLPPLGVVALMFVMYLIMGMFMDGISILLLTVPFVAPIYVSLGFDPIWGGVVTMLVVELGLLTPPIAMNVFMVKGIAGPGTKLSDVYRGVFPFFCLGFGVLLLITVFPQLVLFLPRAIGLV